MLVSPRVREGTHGVHVVTPLVRENGSTILVDRGFVSNEFAASKLEENGQVEILGLLRTSQKRNTFTPNNDPDNGKWYWTDVDAMANYAGGEAAGIQPVFLEQIFGKLYFYKVVSLLSFRQRDTQEKQAQELRMVYLLVGNLQSI